MLSSFQSNRFNHHTQKMVPEKAENNLRNNGLVGHNSNTPTQQDIGIANRAFYATINKFTSQACSDTSTQRRSFLENWHLHNMYSKAQQTLLGISPVKPSVLLSGDDFMFTPPFIQEKEDGELGSDDEDDEDEEEDDYYFWDTNKFYNPKLSQADEISSSFEAATTTTTTTTKDYERPDRHIWIENDEETERPHSLNEFSNLNLLSVHIPSQVNMADSLSSPEEESSSSDDEQLSLSCSPRDRDSSSMASDMLVASFSNGDSDSDSDSDADLNEFDDGTSKLSCHESINLFSTHKEELDRQQKPTVICPVTRPSSFKSQASIASAVSYQSLADLLNPQQYGSMSHSSACNDNEPSTQKSIVRTFVNDDNTLDNEETGQTRTTHERRTASNTVWMNLGVYAMYYWQLFIRFFTTTTRSEESESLL